MVDRLSPPLSLFRHTLDGCIDHRHPLLHHELGLYEWGEGECVNTREGGRGGMHRWSGIRLRSNITCKGWGHSYCRMTTVNPPKLWQLTIHPVDKAGAYRLVWVARRMVVMTTWLRYTCEMHLQWAVTWFYCTFPRCLTHGSWHSRYEWLRRPPEGPQQSSWDEASHDSPRDVYSLQKMSFNQLSCPCHQITFIMTSS